MPNPVAQLRSRLQSAIEGVLGSEYAGSDPVLRRSTQPGFGDFQANAAMALGKRAGRQPRELAQQIVDALDGDDLIAKVEVAGPGFINIWLSDDALGVAARSLLGDPDRLGVDPAEAPETVVIDYSSPNLAKEMHIGHLRSTIIGDSIARVLTFLGHTVIRQNHVGDWGTQFGMLVEHMLEIGAAADSANASLADLNAFYREANDRFKNDAAFADRARERVVKLQSGDEETLELWRTFVSVSLGHARDTYDRLGVLLTDDDIHGESAYNDMLDDVAHEIEAVGVAAVDDGALVVFTEKYDAPLLVRKQDGGYGYGTTDLAGVRYRVGNLGATWLIYVVGSPQTQHLDQVFMTVSRAGWLQPPARAVHVSFGSVLGPDRKMYKTRTGENIKLNELLDEAVARATAKVRDANPDLPSDDIDRLGRAIGIGAVKYADLSNDRIKDYVFDWDRMLAFEGNTGPYLQYAHARIRSIFRRAEDVTVDDSTPIVLADAAERALVLELLGFGDAVHSVAEHLQPHRLCTYLFDLAQSFTAFYESCPVLRAPDEATRSSRLALCEVTARTLARGLDLLGIEAPERM
ncbi:MAG TPA: arginine--tRNA ligase [Acidimicrobiales bacterium]|jgi:arginyl-tRNA synthetase|nr:arginine--tRNA ligase [Acidimicrobiales bacterium]